jgi:hypothetical protein
MTAAAPTPACASKLVEVRLSRRIRCEIRKKAADRFDPPPFVFSSGLVGLLTDRS